jgi:hypothetical protein
MEKNPHNPWDQTVWDPNNPEEAIEDSMHGPTAVNELLNTPPLKLEDGTYHVFGGYYLCGTNTFDAEGKPFIRFKTAPTMGALFHEAQAIQEWVEAYQNGELPAREELGYPEFQYHLTPYFLVGDEAFHLDGEPPALEDQANQEL